VGSLLLQLVPVALGLALTPTAIAGCVLLLAGPRGRLNATAFAAAFAVVYAVIAIVVIASAASSPEPLIGNRTKCWIELVIGLLLLALAANSLRPRPRRQNRRSRMLRMVESATPSTAFTLGLAIAAVNPNVPILIGGLAAIVAAHVTSAQRAVAAGFLLLGAELGLAGPIAWQIVAPRMAALQLGRFKYWLIEHERLINNLVLVLFGCVFAAKGLAGLT